jgi:glutamine synthetase
VNVPEIFGSMVFNDTVMKERLPEDIYRTLKRTIEGDKPLDQNVADIVADAMKTWAVEKGVTHYTHWFQPLSGVTAEKHESFIAPGEGDKVIMKFSGRALIQGEPDASSFPSGGLRATFEARGYTAWDPTSYAFIKDGVLCIPTAFYSYGGEALDTKTPLLRSMKILNREAKRILALFQNPAKRVLATAGAEQEYFLVDREKYNKRKDIIYTGRTLFGSRPPKGQEMDDHYFGSIKMRILDYMREVNQELWKLGILAKMEHNEVAPAQHELVPIFTTANVAADHNQLVMETMRRVAKLHGLTCLVHEKPFNSVNGSGKHINWSLTTEKGTNLLDPGNTPDENAQFLTFLCALIKAVDEYQDLLRLSVASAGNDHRLGGFEAPPAIISMYIGEELDGILTAIETGKPYDKKDAGELRVGVDTLPVIPRDSTDRNRTSSFAFSGNKFEFRMPGSSMSIAEPIMVLNTIVADVLAGFSDELEKAEDFNGALTELLKRTIREHRRVIFNGNGYDEAWIKEAEKRGLSNLPTTADALPHLLDPKNVEVFTKYNIFTKKELESRLEIYLSSYCKTINIEAMTMLDMARADILPAVLSYSKELAETINAKRKADENISSRTEKELLSKISELTDEFYDAINRLEEESEKASCICEERVQEKAMYYKDCVLSAMEKLRLAGDSLEILTGGKYWPYPSYGTLLYRV